MTDDVEPPPKKRRLSLSEAAALFRTSPGRKWPFKCASSPKAAQRAKTADSSRGGRESSDLPGVDEPERRPVKSVEGKDVGPAGKLTSDIFAADLEDELTQIESSIPHYLNCMFVKDSQRSSHLTDGVFNVSCSKNSSKNLTRSSTSTSQVVDRDLSSCDEKRSPSTEPDKSQSSPLLFDDPPLSPPSVSGSVTASAMLPSCNGSCDGVSPQLKGTAGCPQAAEERTGSSGTESRPLEASIADEGEGEACASIAVTSCMSAHHKVAADPGGRPDYACPSTCVSLFECSKSLTNSGRTVSLFVTVVQGEAIHTW